MSSALIAGLRRRRPAARRALGAGILGSLALAAPAAQASQSVSAGDSVARPCHREVSSSAAGRDLVHTRAHARGLVAARLRSQGDWWDIYVLNADGDIVTQSASFGDTTEDATLFDPPPGEYTVHVVNYDQGQNPPDDWSGGNVRFRSPTPRIETGTKEAWTLTCLDANDRVQATREVIVDRGQSAKVGNACARK
jgi:hypothetical protein